MTVALCRKSLLLVSLLILSACQQRQAILITQGIEPVKVKAIETALIQSGWQVNQSTIAIPAEFPNTAITTNPAYRDSQAITEIEDLLKGQGFAEPTEYKFAEGKHFFSINNIGIYLRNSEQVLQPLPPDFIRTDHCTAGDATLNLSPQGQAVLEYERPINDNFELEQHTGTWQFDGAQLSVTLNRAQQVFKLTHEQRPIWRGLSPADIYTPIQDSNFKVLNCTFLLIYLE
ncbi:hypothetical protein [Shewanella sp. 1180_01]|uniref:hypothetical protein n=1 Tax=Shewanella sp. 1180_01 TaxID=2604451 RepID=UPI0040645872